MASMLFVLLPVEGQWMGLGYAFSAILGYLAEDTLVRIRRGIRIAIAIAAIAVIAAECALVNSLYMLPYALAFVSGFFLWAVLNVRQLRWKLAVGCALFAGFVSLCVLYFG